MMLDVKECRQTKLGDGSTIHLIDAPDRLIRAIIFGYNHDEKEIYHSVRVAMNKSSNIKFRRAIADLGTGNIILKDIDV
jgi:ribosome biogenesis SPOUT family RNA methylase Rps3